MKKYRCMNIGNCTIAGTNETFEIAEGEECKCPKCGSTLVAEVSTGTRLPLIIGGVVLVAALAGGGYAFLGGKSTPAPDPDPIPAPAPEPQGPDTDSITKPTPVDPKPVENPGKTGGETKGGGTTTTATAKYDFADFDGTTMTFKKAHVIPGTDIMAQPGDKVQGVWKNGEVNSARYYPADGSPSTVITHK